MVWIHHRLMQFRYFHLFGDLPRKLMSLLVVLKLAGEQDAYCKISKTLSSISSLIFRCTAASANLLQHRLRFVLGLCLMIWTHTIIDWNEMHIQVIEIMMSAVINPPGGSLGGLGKIISMAEWNVDAKYRVRAIACSRLSLYGLFSADTLPLVLLILAGPIW